MTQMTDLTRSPQETGSTFLMQVRSHQVILVASLCLITLVIVLKNLLRIPAEILIRDTGIYLILYLGFLLIAFKPDSDYGRTRLHPRMWSLLVILITLGILGVYAL
jgi:hypothetical protein